MVNIISTFILSFGSLISPLYAFSFAGNMIFYFFTRQVKVQIGKRTCTNKNQSRNADSGGNKTNSPSNFSLKGRVVSNFRQKKDGPIPSEMDIKAFIPAPTICLQTEYCIFGNWKD